MNNKLTTSTLSIIVLNGKTTKKYLLDKCLNSISWADEIILIDTIKEKGSFSDWRNLGYKKATSKWILYIDTDEEVTKDLKQEIQNVINNSSLKSSGYAIPRKNIIFGKEFRYSGQYPDYQKRLFLKNHFTKWYGDLHETPKFEGTLGKIKSPIIHHKDLTIGEMLEKTNEWSEIEGQLMFDANHPKMNLFRFFSAGLREFCLRMVKQMAFLDGPRGVIYAFYQVYSKLISYTKLWEKQQSTIHI